MERIWQISRGTDLIFQMCHMETVFPKALLPYIVILSVHNAVDILSHVCQICKQPQRQEGLLSQTTVWLWPAMMIWMFCFGCGWSVMVSARPLCGSLSGTRGHIRRRPLTQHVNVNMRPQQIAHQSKEKHAQCSDSSKNNKEDPRTVLL